MTRVVLIALDGATLDLLGPWMAVGELPLLARLFAGGSGGTLLSTVPWATPTAFASFATGTNPGKHSVYDFGRLIGEDYTAFVPTNGRNVQGRTLWRILSEAGLKSVVINMPMTYPAEPIEGVLVSGIPYPSGSDRLCYPAGLLNDLKAKGWDLARNASDDLGGNYQDYYDGLLELIRVRGEATAELIQEHQPDFVAVHFLEPDQVQHRFWQFMVEEPRFDPAGAHTHAILNLFKKTELAMQQILDVAGEEAIVCVMSDHGFGPTRHQVWLNNWLMQNGFLALKSSLGVQLKKLLYRLGLSPAAIREAAPERLKLAILQFFERQKGRAIAEQLEQDTEKVQRKGLMDWLTERLAIDFYDVEWSKTLAFSTGTTSVGYVWLNLVGRDPQGIVRPEAYEQVRQEVATTLRSWEAVGEVHFREELWQGAQLDKAPDIIVRWAQPSTDARYFQTRFSSHHLMKPVPNDYAGHRPEGMFVWWGGSVRPGQTIHANILDLTPTILWLLDQPVPTNMDGEVMTDCFDLDKPIITIEPPQSEDGLTDEADRLSGGRLSADRLSDEDEAAIMDSLRSLGYIE